MCRVRNEQLIKYFQEVGLVRSQKRLVPHYKNNGRVWYLRPANSHFVYNVRLKWNPLGQLYCDELVTFFYLRYFSRIRFVADRWSEVGYLFDLVWRNQFSKRRKLAVYVSGRLAGETVLKYNKYNKNGNNT